MTVSAVSSRGRALIREAVADLRGQRLKALALLAVLACVAALALVVERDAATARADLDALLASPVEHCHPVGDAGRRPDHPGADCRSGGERNRRRRLPSYSANL